MVVGETYRFDGVEKQRYQELQIRFINFLFPTSKVSGSVRLTRLRRTNQIILLEHVFVLRIPVKE